MSLLPSVFHSSWECLCWVLRLEDHNAWLLALLFAGFICGAPLFEGSISPHLRGLAAGYKTTFGSLVPASSAFSLLTFPTPSPIDRPTAAPQGRPPLRDRGLFHLPGPGLSASGRGSPDILPVRLGQQETARLATYCSISLACMGLGFVSLVWNGVPTRHGGVLAARPAFLVWGMLADWSPLCVFTRVLPD